MLALLLVCLLQSPKDTDPAHFDLSGLPPRPTNFEEQKIEDSVKYATSPALQAFAHRQLARYYVSLGRADLAAGEFVRAALAYPEDPRGYQGLAQVAQALDAPAGDGKVKLQQVADKLTARGLEGASPEPPPKVDRLKKDPVVTAEFNRRMNYLYTSQAWQRLNRTLFPNLYRR